MSDEIHLLVSENELSGVLETLRDAGYDATPRTREVGDHYYVVSGGEADD